MQTSMCFFPVYFPPALHLFLSFKESVSYLSSVTSKAVAFSLFSKESRQTESWDLSLFMVPPSRIGKLVYTHPSEGLLYQLEIPKGVGMWVNSLFPVWTGGLALGVKGSLKTWLLMIPLSLSSLLRLCQTIWTTY